ncbi:EAL domain-containing protein [Rheinheimera sp. FR7-31]|uniref:EAL domain-containing protein n=1 Tax=Rheinheimera fenheensis TaxID=3152295 RepID=UPI00325D6066
MSLLAFTTDSTDLSLTYHGHHAGMLVLLSLLIAILAAYTSFSHRHLMQQAVSTLSYRLWLSSGSVAMGLGVWAMHFTGMMSLQLPVEVGYQLSLTLLSVLPAIAAAYITLNVVAADVQRPLAIVRGGALMGAGIGCMHYLGMAAMVMQAERLYKPLLFVLSVLVAVLLATLALWVRPLLSRWLANQLLLELISSVVMGLAIASMHYVAMHATVFLPAEKLHGLGGMVMSKQTLGTLAVVVAVAILLLSTITVLMRRRVLDAEQSRYQAMLETQQLALRLQGIASRVPGLVYEFRLTNDGHFSFPYASEAIRDIYGISPEQAKQDALPVLEAIHPDDRDAMMQSVYRSAEQLSVWHHEYRVQDSSGKVRWLLGNAQPLRDADGVSWSGFITDVTARKAIDQQMQQLAYFDSLTGLFNRGKIQQQLQQLCDEAGTDGAVAVILLDIDQFKRLNDTQGHQAGDQLLIQLASRLRMAAPAHAYCGRLSGDEFVLLLAGASQQELGSWAEQYCSSLRELMRQAFDIQQHQYCCTVSLGYCLAHSGASSDELLKQAAIALSHAKAQGGNSHVGFNPAMTVEIQQRYQLELALAAALADKQFELHYQPQLTDTGKVVGVEALLRWQHPELGYVSPARFIPLAEETGQIDSIGYWVLQQACAQLQRWQNTPLLRDLVMSVNISARQFYQPEFVTQVEQCLQIYQLKPPQLMLELTESLILADLDDAVSRMQQIKQMGVRFSMDDFGTGYSSLSYLSRLPFDEVKIDQYFVRSASSGKPRDWVIVEAIIGIANTFGMKLIAEGVETEVQRELLRQSGCYCYQGYLFAKPARAADIASWITGHSQSD